MGKSKASTLLHPEPTDRNKTCAKTTFASFWAEKGVSSQARSRRLGPDAGQTRRRVQGDAERRRGRRGREKGSLATQGEAASGWTLGFGLVSDSHSAEVKPHGTV